MKLSRLQLYNLIQESLEGKEGEWTYKIISIEEYENKDELTPEDVKGVRVKVVSGPSNINYEFPLSDVETNEGTTAYEKHPLVLQVIESIKNNENLDSVTITTRNPIVDGSGDIFLSGDGFMAVSPKQLMSAHPSISNDLAVYSLSSFRKYFKTGKIKHNNKMIIVDYTIPGNKVRLWCLKVENNKVKVVVASDVAHGKGNGVKGSASVSKFSNGKGTNAASVGAFITGEIYHSTAGNLRKYSSSVAAEEKENRRKYTGIALRIKGLDKTNNNDLSRGIIIHGAWYRDKGRTGRSYGCLATKPSTNKKIIDFLGTGTFGYKFGGRMNAASVDTSWLNL